jgi:DNA-binding response OmpR family regulator
MTNHLLLVDADDLLRPSLAGQLIRQGFQVTQAASAEAALPGAEGTTPDLVVIDAGLPDLGAARLCRDWRQHDPMVPIVVLGVDARQSAQFRAAGASECVAKPFRFSHLSQRLHDHLRIGGFRFYPVGRLIVDASGRQVHLTEKEAAILIYLHRAGGRAVGREELLGEVWRYACAVSTHTVETHIHRLRRKLGDGNAALLCTEDGGYRLAAISTTTGT